MNFLRVLIIISFCAFPLPSRGQHNGLTQEQEKEMVKRAIEAEKRFNAKPNPKNQVVVPLSSDVKGQAQTETTADAPQASDAGCPECTKQKLLDALKVKASKTHTESEPNLTQKSTLPGACETYPFSEGCDASSNALGFGFTANTETQTVNQSNGKTIEISQCKICFTQQIAKGDFCGDPKTMPVYKVENMAALLVKKSADVCKAAVDQFSKMCAPWKSAGSPAERRQAINKIEGALIQGFNPDSNKVITVLTNNPKLQKSRYLKPSLMLCLMDRENGEGDPSIPNFSLCKNDQYKATIANAKGEFRKLKTKGTPDEISRADAELHTFENQNDPGPYDRPYALKSLSAYHASLSSATGLDMVTRSTMYKFNNDSHIYENQCKEFGSFWGSADRLVKDPSLKPFIVNRQCKDGSERGDSESQPNSTERIFGLKSKDPVIQLEVMTQTVNYLLNVVEDQKHGSGDAIVRETLEQWFGGAKLTRNCYTNEVLACQKCLDAKGIDDKSCFELAHPANNACSSVAAVNNQVKQTREKRAKAAEKKKAAATKRGI